jgi:serine/threonine-protein kinase
MTQTTEAPAATGADDPIVKPESASDGTQGVGPDSVAPHSASRLVAGRYRLIEPLGRGGMGRVYRGHDDLLDRPVAVKLIYDDAVSDRDLRRACAVEARAAARLSHPGIVRILDSGFDDGHCFVVMEIAEGPTLAEMLRDEGALPVDRALGLAAQLADALEAAHREGVIHCDVKPGNVVIDALDRTRLVDFGIARVVTSTTGLSDSDIQGSAKYVAPEQVEGAQVDGRTDLYALGVVLFEMLAGQPPFAGGNLASILAQRLVAEPPSLREARPDVPPQVEQIVRRAMERDPAHRYQTAGELRDALRAARDEAPAATTMPFAAFAPIQQPRKSPRTPIWERAAAAAGPMATSALTSGRRLVGTLGTALPASLPRPALTWPSRWPSLGTGIAMASLLGLLVGVMAAQCVTAGVATESALTAPPVEAAAAQEEVVLPTLIPAPAVAAAPTDPPPAPTQTAVPPTSTQPPPTDTPPTAEPAPTSAPAIIAAPRIRVPAPVQGLDVQTPPATGAPEAESSPAEDRDQSGPPSDKKPDEKKPKPFEQQKPEPKPENAAPANGPKPGGPNPHPQPYPTQVEPPKPAPKPQPATKPQEPPKVELRQSQPPSSSQGNGNKEKEKKR